MEDKSRNVQDRPRKRQYGRVLLDALAEIILRLSTFIFGFAWWGLKWGIATVIFLAIMALAGFYVFNEATANDAATRVGGKAYVVVPELQGKYKDAARRTIEDAGLSYGESKPMPSTKLQRDYVMVQRPEPGSVVRAGRRVFVTLSEGQEQVVVPDLVGKKEVDARNAIEEKALTVGPLAHLARNEPAGQVVSQYPPAGQSVQRSTAVSLMISEGQETAKRILVPNVVGLSLEDAKSRLTSSGLGMDLIKDTDPGAEIGVVLKQYPEEGKELTDGGTVTVNVRLQNELPGMQERVRERVQVRYQVPSGFVPREVRIVAIDAFGERSIAFQQKVAPSYAAIVTLSYSSTMTAEIYLDNALVQRIVYQEGRDPVVTNF